MRGLPFTGIATFLGWPSLDQERLPRPASERRLVALGVPYDEGTPYRPGARLGPRAIRDASTRLRFGSPDGLGFYDIERRTKIELAAAAWDGGDIEVVPGDQAATFELISDAVAGAVAVGVVPVLLGGDNSITFPALRGVEQPGPVVIQFDAHLDYGESYFGAPHGNSTPLRAARRAGLCSKVLHLGARGYDNSERDLAATEADGNLVVGAGACREGAAITAIESLAPGTSVYVSLDIDVADPAIAPGTGYLEPGGLDYPLLRRLAHAVASRCEVIGCELVEVSPPYDPDGATTILGVQLLIDLLGAEPGRHDPNARGGDHLE